MTAESRFNQTFTTGNSPAAAQGAVGRDGKPCNLCNFGVPTAGNRVFKCTIHQFGLGKNRKWHFGIFKNATNSAVQAVNEQPVDDQFRIKKTGNGISLKQPLPVE